MSATPAGSVRGQQSPHPLPMGIDKGTPLDPPGGQAERLFLLSHTDS